MYLRKIKKKDRNLNGRRILLIGHSLNCQKLKWYRKRQHFSPNIGNKPSNCCMNAGKNYKWELLMTKQEKYIKPHSSQKILTSILPSESKNVYDLEI
jgi:hypothetical protein